MAKNKFQYFIGVGLPEKEDKFFAYLKQQFHPKGNLSSPAHVTLIPPFFYDDETKLVKNLELLNRKHHAFKVIFKEIDTFHQSKSGTVYLAPSPANNFIDIFENIHQLIPHLPKKRGNNYVPHLTIANRVELSEVENIKELLGQMKIMLELKVNSIYLYRRQYNQSWEKYQEIKLK